MTASNFSISIRFHVCFFLALSFLWAAVSVAQDHPDSPGITIHSSTVDGYELKYVLYHFPQKKSQHLMVSIKGPGGELPAQGKVGFLITGSDGANQKVMAMGMKNAYGADVHLDQKGVYTVKMKAVLGDKKLFDTFQYEVKQNDH